MRIKIRFSRTNGFLFSGWIKKRNLKMSRVTFFHSETSWNPGVKVLIYVVFLLPLNHIIGPSINDFSCFRFQPFTHFELIGFSISIRNIYRRMSKQNIFQDFVKKILSKSIDARKNINLEVIFVFIMKLHIFWLR